jgi:ABC-2 type transport system ATP-binding protein
VKSVEKQQSGGGSEIVAVVRDVTVTFDGYLTRALSRVDLEVRRGEVFGILGAKGAGKSTLVKLLAGRVRPTEGKVRIFGRSPRGGSTKARIGYVPGKEDSNRPHGFLSRIFGRNNGTSPDVARGKPGLTQAILGSRELVILDEPFADTGPAERAELKALIRELAGRGKTVIVASDTLADAKDVCDRLAVFHEGKIQAIGSLEELLRVPAAIHFFAPVLPPEVAGRIARILREAIKSDSKSAASIRSASGPQENAREAETSKTITPDEHLTALTKANESPTLSETNPKEAGSIDHEKLEGLTKPVKPE